MEDLSCEAVVEISVGLVTWRASFGRAARLISDVRWTRRTSDGVGAVVGLTSSVVLDYIFRKLFG